MDDARALEIAIEVQNRKHARLLEMTADGFEPAQIARELYMPLTTVVRQIKNAATAAETSNT